MSIERLYSANLRPGPSPLLLPMRELRQGSGSSKPHINPSVLVIVIILSVVFLCSGILHILARCLGRRRAREVPGGLLSGSSPGNSLRGQLQHLFSLHDSGVEQVFIDTLPVFLYGSIRGLKDSADCAVCLNEFANEDKLRLLPKCKHAFHTECIDTWLLSNSTCPLCRRSLLPEAEPVFTACAPPEDQVATANATTTQPSHGSFRGSFRASLRGSFRFLTEVVAPPPPAPPPPAPPPPPEPANITSTPTPPMTPGPTVSVPQPDGSEKTLRVELGRVNIDRIATRDVGSSRMARSYSMGSYEYIVDFSSLGLAMQGEPSSSMPPTHRSSLSDGIPELSSASHTPGQEDMFWASRGLDTPHSLSRVREIMTPSPGWNSSPLFLASQKQKQQQQLVKMGQEEDDDGGEIRRSTSLNATPNPNSNASVGMVESASVPVSIQTAQEAEEEASPVQRPLSPSLSLALLRSPKQELGAAARKDKVWEVSMDVSEPPQEKSPSSMKSSPLNWLRGRGRRLVYSAASPSATDPQQQSPEVKNTT